jgi:hypothetical protein
MQRIYADGTQMKIEHWQSQDNYPQFQLTYQNLLGGCKGGEGWPAKLQHCDTRKGNSDLLYNPADPTHHIETRIAYGLDGSIHAVEPEFNEQLERVLNLNLPRIKNNRKSVLNALLTWWKREKRRLQGPVPKAQIEHEIQRRTNARHLSPYCQVAVWWLNKKL